MTIFGFIFFSLVFVGILVWVYIEQDDDFLISLFPAIFASIVGTIFSVFVLYGLSTINSKHEKSKTFGVTYISSLSTNSSVSGDFFLGSGTIDSKTYYYYVSNSELGYRISKIENTNVYIREDCDKKPYIEYTKYNCIHQNWFSKIFFLKEAFDDEREIIIHVPRNTIVKNYSVDVSKL